jgi:hypothetical protein
MPDDSLPGGTPCPPSAMNPNLGGGLAPRSAGDSDPATSAGGGDGQSGDASTIPPLAVASGALPANRCPNSPRGAFHDKSDPTTAAIAGA